MDSPIADTDSIVIVEGMDSTTSGFTVDYAGRGSMKLADLVGGLVAGAGKVVDARMYSPEEGGGWIVVLDTEYAALKVAHKYRHSNVSMGEAATGGWYVAVR
jgi:hypothetical protein